MNLLLSLPPFRRVATTTTTTTTATTNIIRAPGLFPSLLFQFTSVFRYNQPFEHPSITIAHCTMAVPATTTKTATPKAANAAGVKKTGPKGGRVGKKNNARTAMAKMQAYCKSALFDAFCRVTWTRSSHAAPREWRSFPGDEDH